MGSDASDHSLSTVSPVRAFTTRVRTRNSYDVPGDSMSLTAVQPATCVLAKFQITFPVRLHCKQNTSSAATPDATAHSRVTLVFVTSRARGGLGGANGASCDDGDTAGMCCGRPQTSDRTLPCNDTASLDGRAKSAVPGGSDGGGGRGVGDGV